MTRRITRAEVVACVERWRVRLQLDKWKIRVRLTTKTGGMQAEFDPLREYWEAVVRINPDLVPPEELEEVVVHELCHAITWDTWQLLEDAARGDAEMEKRATKAIEDLTTTLQRVVMR